LLSKEAFTCAYTSGKRSSETTAPAARQAARQACPYRAPVPLRRRYAPSGPDNRGNRVITAGDRRGCPESAHVPCPSAPHPAPTGVHTDRIPDDRRGTAKKLPKQLLRHVTPDTPAPGISVDTIPAPTPVRIEVDRPAIHIGQSQPIAGTACVRLPAGRRAAGPTPASIDDPTARPGGSRPGGPVPWPVPGWQLRSGDRVDR
jgi:hypothetical protein